MRYRYHERQRAYASVIQLAERLRARDHQLTVASKRMLVAPLADLPDGYPRGGDGVGRSSGVSDSTGGAVMSRLGEADPRAEYAEDAVASLFEALGALKAADASAAKALDAPVTLEPEKARPPRSVFCVSCARLFPKELRDKYKHRTVGEAIAFEPRHGFTNRSRADLCSWCLVEFDATGQVPDIELVLWRDDHPGRHVTARVRAEVLGKPQLHSAAS